ncbi:MAG: acyl-CoA reductase [Cytophagales bacterium]|nr:acyl-CoA reductase [Cytophagales bacterium]
MTLPDRLSAFAYLGNDLRQLPHSDFEQLARRATAENGWFSEASVTLALNGVDRMLEEEKLRSWALEGAPDQNVSRQIGVAMAGNIPLVGFHDFLTVLISGHRLKYKPSSRDSVLLGYIQERLLEIEPRFDDAIESSDTLHGVDALIATGSDNTARYFEYYFRNIPHLIRKNRVSCAILRGDESGADLDQLGTDIFSYYGLGCRNVSSVFVPQGYDMQHFLASLQAHKAVMENHKYANNYLYQKTLAHLNKERILDNGFVLLKENSTLVSPVATLYYETYGEESALKARLESLAPKLQVSVSANGWFEESIPFGTAQLPLVTDYADRVDTLHFLRRVGKPR